MNVRCYLYRHWHEQGKGNIILLLNTDLTGNNQFDHPGQVKMHEQFLVFYQDIDSVKKQK